MGACGAKPLLRPVFAWGHSVSGAYRAVDTSSGIQASLAGRYASALFGLARDERQIDAVGRSLDALASALAGSPEFAALVASPLVSRDDAAKAFAGLGPELGLDPITTNFLGVLARNGRKRELGKIIRAFRRIAADHRGEISAEITSAHPLKDDQVEALKAQLGKRAGRDVTIDAQVDPNILGGIVIKLGSEMIDASIRTKLNRLAQAMRG
jgi:F-type H+-transporting ATPase subunit delta